MLLSHVRQAPQQSHVCGAGTCDKVTCMSWLFDSLMTVATTLLQVLPRQHRARWDERRWLSRLLLPNPRQAMRYPSRPRNVSVREHLEGISLGMLCEWGVEVVVVPCGDRQRELLLIEMVCLVHDLRWRVVAWSLELGVSKRHRSRSLGVNVGVAGRCICHGIQATRRVVECLR